MRRLALLSGFSPSSRSRRRVAAVRPSGGEPGNEHSERNQRHSGDGDTTRRRRFSGPGALAGEANAAAAGDIPDNQVFLVFRNGRAGYSMKYPEGWAQRGPARVVVFRDKNNIVRIVVGAGAARRRKRRSERELARLTGARRRRRRSRSRCSGGRALKVVYTHRERAERGHRASA